MKRLLLASALGCASAMAIGVGGAAAAAPQRACPTGGGYDLLTFQQSRDLVIDAGFPGDISRLNEFLVFTDVNDDQRLCVKDIPDTPGNPPYVFVFVDNGANPTASR